MRNQGWRSEQRDDASVRNDARFFACQRGGWEDVGERAHDAGPAGALRGSLRATLPRKRA